MKKIGFLSFGHWRAAVGSQTRTASEALLQTIELALFDQLQAEQIRLYREAWAQEGFDREPRVSVSRTVLPITTDIDRVYFGG